MTQQLEKEKQVYWVACPGLQLRLWAYFKNEQRKMDIQVDSLIYEEKQNPIYWVA